GIEFPQISELVALEGATVAAGGVDAAGKRGRSGEGRAGPNRQHRAATDLDTLVTDAEIGLACEVDEKPVEIGLVASAQLAGIKLGVGEVRIRHDDLGKRVEGKQAAEGKPKSRQHNRVKSEIESFVEVKVAAAGDNDEARVISAIEQGDQIAFRAPEA